MIMFAINQKIIKPDPVEDAGHQQQGDAEEGSAAQVVELNKVNRQLRREIKQQKRVEAALHQQIAALQLRNETLDAFAYAVAHNLKNPLSVVTGVARMLETDETIRGEERLVDCLQMIARSGEKANSIIEALLLLARLEHQQVEKKPVAMADIMATLLLRLGPMIETYRATLILPEQWPGVLGYGPWIEEVWCNYLSNGIKYGGRPPRLELGAMPQADGMVCLWVRDNGPGLTAEEQARLFKPFSRLQKIEIEGEGLGLSIVRCIVEKLGGQVGVESAGIPGQGSEFWFALPGAQK
jgi:signal transduction histidine kinase